MADIKHALKTLLYQRFRLLDEKEKANGREYYPQYEKGMDDGHILENELSLHLLGVNVGHYAESIEMEDREAEGEERRVA